MTETDIPLLLHRYMNGATTSGERAALKEALAHLSDERLSAMLFAIWQEYGDEVRNDLCFDDLTRRLQINPGGSQRRLTLRRLARTAAILLLPLLACATICLYRQTTRLTSFLHRETDFVVHSGSPSQLLLPDGTEVFLNAATRLSFPSRFGFDRRTISLEGEAYLKVAKNRHLPFRVNTDRLEIEVAGTEFNLIASDDVIETTLVAGSVRLTGKGRNRQTVVLSPHEKAIYHKDRDTITVHETSTRFETAWLRGELIFRSAGFADIMQKIQQRYGVIIQIEGDRYDTDLFTGSFEENSVYGILKNLQLHYHFTWITGPGDTIRIRLHRPDN
jgi:ferric-dicitrate binding protein FerR (iron transport regulator)